MGNWEQKRGRGGGEREDDGRDFFLFKIKNDSPHMNLLFNFLNSTYVTLTLAGVN